MSADREGLDLLEKVQEQRRRQGWHNGAKVVPFVRSERIDDIAWQLKVCGNVFMPPTP